jgi:hypothetical protein
MICTPSTANATSVPVISATPRSLRQAASRREGHHSTTPGTTAVARTTAPKAATAQVDTRYSGKTQAEKSSSAGGP